MRSLHRNGVWPRDCAGHCVSIPERVTENGRERRKLSFLARTNWAGETRGRGRGGGVPTKGNQMSHAWCRWHPCSSELLRIRGVRRVVPAGKGITARNERVFPRG